MSSSGVFVRALLVLAFGVGFYVLAFAIVGVLLWVPYADWTYSNRLHPKIALSALFAAGVIAWSIVPRRTPWTPPGPPLTEDEHPALFAEIRRTAEAAGEDPPAEVYLVSDVNAFVSTVGGFLGLGGRRVLGLGLPLLQTLTVSQVRAVIAHEFGHYAGGDTRLAHLVYQTRAAMSRTIENLGKSESILEAPFRWYGDAYLRVSHAVARWQEYQADALAVRIAGRGPAAAALTAVHGAAAAYDAYWRDELVPVIEAGFRPPVAEGFATFLARPNVAETVRRITDRAKAEATTDPHDTHPALPDRLAALDRVPSGPEEHDDRSALVLLGDVARAEERLIAHLVVAGHEVRALPWGEVAERVWLPAWRRLADRVDERMPGLAPARLPELLADPTAVLTAFTGEAPAPEHAPGQAADLLGRWLTVRLVDAGWHAHAGVGEPMVVRRGDAQIDARAETRRLVAGEDPAGWPAKLQAWGLV